MEPWLLYAGESVGAVTGVQSAAAVVRELTYGGDTPSTRARTLDLGFGGF
jgi:hypothetical protein